MAIEESPKRLYIYPGEGQTKLYLGQYNNIEVVIDYSWNGGYTTETLSLDVKATLNSDNKHIKIEEWSVSGQQVTTSNACFIYSITIKNDTMKVNKTFTEIGEIKETVISEERSF